MILISNPSWAVPRTRPLPYQGLNPYLGPCNFMNKGRRVKDLISLRSQHRGQYCAAISSRISLVVVELSAIEFSDL